MAILERITEEGEVQEIETPFSEKELGWFKEIHEIQNGDVLTQYKKNGTLIISNYFL